MANILLTEKCVRSCPYCFAQEHMDGAESERTITWDNLIYIADLLEISGDAHLSLLGGEPTLHPDFIDFVLYLLERNFHVNVFTSGIMSKERLKEAERYLGRANPEKLSFTCNMNHPDISAPKEIEKVEKFLKVFGHLTSPGFNIYEPEFNLDFILQYINKYGLKRHVRIGLAHPIPGEKNVYVALKDMKKMAERFMHYERIFERLRIAPGFDCGMPMCLFSEEQIGKLYKITKGNLRYGCGPAIDIGPDMNVWSCFPLSNFQKKPIYDFNSIQEIRTYYEKVHEKIRIEVGGVFEKCDDCRYREINLCLGGCLAHALSGFKKEAPVRPEDVY